MPGSVHIIGAGLLGASIGLRLRQLGTKVYLEDASPAAQALARDLGAGRIADEEALDESCVSFVVVATPPDVVAEVVRAALERFPHAVVIDVASVKERVLDEITDHPQARRYVGSHPMAGRERSGAIAADADLFIGRPWVIVPSSVSEESAVEAVRAFALDMGGLPIQMQARAHDRAVALVSHMPQLMSSLVAGALRASDPEALELAGQGLRDVTRIAHSDSALWASIVAGNAQAVVAVLRPLSEELTRLISALEPGVEDPFAHGVLAGVSRVVARGNEGVVKIPGKHGGAAQRYSEVFVLVPDRPGELGRLFTEIGEIGVNIEDLQLEHSVAQKFGRAMVSVDPVQASHLAEALEARGWQVIVEGREKRMNLVIAIDGPSGSGKSTVARAVATKLGLAYLDTGAMYRAAAWWCKRHDVVWEDEAAVARLVRDMSLDMPITPEEQTIMCNGEEITQVIRTSEISLTVPIVARNLAVRAELRKRQREIIAAQPRGIVVEGRDITTVVAPDAKVRALITASEEARLRRRALDVRGEASEGAMEATRKEVVDRDKSDATVSQFLTAPEGVSLIDSSDLSIEETVEAVIALIPKEAM